jgi:hypothetical protein
MRRTPALLLTFLMSVAAACSDDDGGSIFDQAPPSTAEPVDTLTLEVAGEAWELPAAVCRRNEGDDAVVMAAAQERAAEVRSLVGHLVSGWPTTSYALDFDYESYDRDLRRAGATALLLAALVNEQESLEDAWEEWEQAFGDSEQGWGPPAEISDRLPSWKAEAETLADAVAAHCAG